MKDDIIILSHGAGGKLTAELIGNTFLPEYGNTILNTLGDGAVLPEISGHPVLTTDSYVVRPYIFPGGDIGSLSIHGTVNDLLMCGADPAAVSIAFILEEGLPLRNLESICKSIGEAARTAGVNVVTGDTKVVERGHGHGIYINTTGIGERKMDCIIGPDRVEIGDKIIINGPIGQHGIAILVARNELSFSTTVKTDSKALVDEVESVLSFKDEVKILHDPTRGGLATCLNEIARETNKRVFVKEEKLPRDQSVQSACELLGFDPLYIANEGKFVAVAAPESAEEILEAVRKAGSPEAAIIGEIVEGDPLVIGESPSGGERLLDVLTGDPLPRIC